MDKVLIIIVMCSLLSACAHFAGVGEAYPYRGPLIDNSGAPVAPPQSQGAK